MHKEDWIYYGRLKRHIVQLFHFLASGRVIVKLNGVLLYEEKLLENEEGKNINFFIDDELCELIIAKTEDSTFTYRFITHSYSTSRTGKKRKFQAWLEEVWVGVGLACVGLFIIIPLAYFLIQHYYQDRALVLGGMTSTGIITRLGKPKDNQYPLTLDVYYKFLVNNTWYFGSKQVKAIKGGKHFTTPLGVQLGKNSEFEVLFSGRYPEVSDILFNTPSSKQLSKYYKRIREVCLNSQKELPNGSLNSQMIYCDCLTKQVYYQYGIEGLAHLYFQNTDNQTNKHYNKKTYDNFISKVMQQKINNICLEAASP